MLRHRTVPAAHDDVRCAHGRPCARRTRGQPLPQSWPQVPRQRGGCRARGANHPGTQPGGCDAGADARHARFVGGTDPVLTRNRTITRLYTYGAKPADRRLTVADLRQAKGQRKLSEVTADTHEEAAAAEAAGVDTL